METTFPGPVHCVQNIGNDPNRFQTACRRYTWVSVGETTLLDPNRKSLYEVTCPQCIAAMLNGKPQEEAK